LNTQLITEEMFIMIKYELQRTLYSKNVVKLCNSVDKINKWKYLRKIDTIDSTNEKNSLIDIK